MKKNKSEHLQDSLNKVFKEIFLPRHPSIKSWTWTYQHLPGGYHIYTLHIFSEPKSYLRNDLWDDLETIKRLLSLGEAEKLNLTIEWNN